jgi:hypothetical protein
MPSPQDAMELKHDNGSCVHFAADLCIILELAAAESLPFIIILAINYTYLCLAAYFNNVLLQ